MSTRHPAHMGAQEYAAYVNEARGVSPVAAVALVMRESRYVTGAFPPYSSGAGDLISAMLGELHAQWSEEGA